MEIQSLLWHRVLRDFSSRYRGAGIMCGYTWTRAQGNRLWRSGIATIILNCSKIHTAGIKF
jgi:hypothetical protein